jgi:hypothetical protein
MRERRNAYGILVYMHIYTDGPKSNENDFLRSAVGPGKGSGSRGRWWGNPGIQFDLAQLSPRLYNSRYVSSA